MSMDLVLLEKIGQNLKSAYSDQTEGDVVLQAIAAIEHAGALACGVIQDDDPAGCVLLAKTWIARYGSGWGMAR